MKIGWTYSTRCKNGALVSTVYVGGRDFEHALTYCGQELENRRSISGEESARDHLRLVLANGGRALLQWGVVNLGVDQ